jgi:hypothetical protein
MPWEPMRRSLYSAATLQAAGAGPRSACSADALGAGRPIHDLPAPTPYVPFLVTTVGNDKFINDFQIAYHPTSGTSALV